MQWIVISLVALAICEPLLLDAKKVVVMMPRKHRRSHSSPLHQLIMYAKKNGNIGQNYPGQRHGYSQVSQYYRQKELPFAKDQYPQGGDDFDQGHEKVNHVFVPHGKGITHAVSFGNGYIPYDSYKRQPSVSLHHNYNTEDSKDVAYSQTMNLPIGPAYSQALLSQQASAYIGQEDYNGQNEIHDRNHNNAAQIGNGRGLHDFANPQGIGTHFAGVQGMLIAQPTGSVTSSAIPSVTIGGSKQGIVLRDSIAFDQYNRQVAEFTKNWPANFGPNNLIHGATGNNHQGIQQLQGLSRQYDGNGLTGLGYSGGSNFVSSLSQDQGKKGYAVKEDVVDTAPHDFRTMPMQTFPVQHLSDQHLSAQHLPIQIPQRSTQPIIRQQAGQHLIQPSQQIIHQQAAQQIIHQQPAQHTLQNFLQQSQVPVNYAMSNFQGLVHG